MVLTKIKTIAQRNTPRWLIFVIELFIAAFSFILTCYLFDMFKDNSLGLRNLLSPFIVVMLFRAKGFLITRSYTGILKYTSVQDAARIVAAVFLSSLGLFLVESLLVYTTGAHLLEP